MTVYDYVKALADEKNVAISTVEKDCGLGNKTIAGWKTSYPRLDVIGKIAEYFKVDIGYFLNGTSSNHLSEEEQELLNIFRNTTQRGRFEMIHAILQVRDEIEKKQSEAV